MARTWGTGRKLPKSSSVEGGGYLHENPVAPDGVEWAAVEGGGGLLDGIITVDEDTGVTITGDPQLAFTSPNDVMFESSAGGSLRFTVNDVESIQIASDGGSGTITSLRDQVDFNTAPTLNGVRLVSSQWHSNTAALAMPGLGGTDNIATYVTPTIVGSDISVDNFGIFHLAAGRYKVELALRLISGDATYSGGFIDLITNSVANIGASIQNVFLHMPLEANGIDTKTAFGFISASSGATFRLGIDNEVADSMDQTAVVSVSITKIA
jgi:hypothetical protein